MCAFLRKAFHCGFIIPKEILAEPGIVAVAEQLYFIHGLVQRLPEFRPVFLPDFAEDDSVLYAFFSLFCRELHGDFVPVEQGIRVVVAGVDVDVVQPEAAAQLDVVHASFPPSSVRFFRLYHSTAGLVCFRRFFYFHSIFPGQSPLPKVINGPEMNCPGGSAVLRGSFTCRH